MPPPSEHPSALLSPLARWVLAHGDALVPVAFGLMALLLVAMLALVWLQGGARLIVAVWVWRQALAWWRARGNGGASGRHRGARGGGGYSLEYQAVMRSAGWRRRRSQALRAAGRRCQECGAAGPLDVHHLTYARLGRERPGDVVALCAACHLRAHGRSGAGQARVPQPGGARQAL